MDRVKCSSQDTNTRFFFIKNNFIRTTSLDFWPKLGTFLIKNNSSLSNHKQTKKKSTQNNQIVFNNDKCLFQVLFLVKPKTTLEINITCHAGLLKSASLFSNLFLLTFLTESRFHSKMYLNNKEQIKNKK